MLIASRAGIIGLTSALRIQACLGKGYRILLVARDFPIEESINYASMWAGAHVRPIPGDTKQLREESAWLVHTYEVLKKQAADEPWAGITALEGVEYLMQPSEDYLAMRGDYSKTPGFKVLERDELPTGAEVGFRYDTFCINSPLYCSSLLRQFRTNGGHVLRKSLASEKEGFALTNNVKCVINASGTGFGDPRCFPTRGT